MHWGDFAAIMAQIAVLAGVAVKLWRTPALNTRTKENGFAGIQKSTADLLRASAEALRGVQKRVDELEGQVQEQTKEISKLTVALERTRAQLERAQKRIQELEKEIEQYRAANALLNKRIQELLARCGQ